jgi:hypothetical protein
MSIVDMIREQRDKHDETLEGARLVPPDYFLPKDKHDALRALAELIYSVRRETLRMDYVTPANEELDEILDLIERS